MVPLSSFSLLLAGFISIVALFFSLFICLPQRVILFTYSIVIVFDGASQIAGQIMGKTKILPQISPGKTLAGLLGGLLSALITSAILHNLISLTIIQSVVSGMVVSFASFLGDMIASMYKRRFGVKDFGSLLPGQGGVLDRFDSFIFSGAILGLINLIFRFSNFEFDSNLLYYIGYSSLFLIILFIGEIIYSSTGNHKAENSRIFSHFACGMSMPLSYKSLFFSMVRGCIVCPIILIYLYYKENRIIQITSWSCQENKRKRSFLFGNIDCILNFAHRRE